VKYSARLYHAVPVLTALILLSTCNPVFAGVIGDIQGWLLNKAVFAIIPIVLGFGILAIWTDWICLMLVSTGGLLTTVGLAFRDRRLTKDEASGIKAEFATLAAAIKKVPRGRK